MTVLSDYEVIQSDEVEIGDATGGNPWTKNFDTGGRLDEQAFIMLMVKGLNRQKNAEVRVNDRKVGEIFPTSGPDNNWSTQTIVFEGSVLNKSSGANNRIAISAVVSDIPTIEGVFEDFTIRNVVCSFRQNSD
jgi:hypothetical protein